MSAGGAASRATMSATQLKELAATIFDPVFSSALGNPAPTPSSAAAQRVLDVRMGLHASVLKACPLFTEATRALRRGGSTLGESVESVVSSELEKAAGHGLLAALCSAVSCLRLYTRLNYTGPPLCGSPIVDRKLDEEALNDLALSGEEPEPTLKVPFLLLFARCVLLRNQDRLRALGFAPKWCLGRYCRLHQAALSANVPDLRDVALSTWTFVSDDAGLRARGRNVRARANIEAANAYLTYWDSKRADAMLAAARDASGVRISSRGVMGKRTKYQEESKSQLLVTVHSSDDVLRAEAAAESEWVRVLSAAGVRLIADAAEKGPEADEGSSKGEGTAAETKEEKAQPSSSGPVSDAARPTASDLASQMLPEDKSLDSEYILDYIRLDDVKNAPKLVARLDRALALTQAYQKWKNTPSSDTIGRQQCLALVRAALHRPSTVPAQDKAAADDEAVAAPSWSVTYSGLYQRSMLEARDSELAQRSLFQLEILYRHVLAPARGATGNTSSCAAAALRACESDESEVPPLWAVGLSLADGYEKLGMTQSAMEEYTRLLRWDRVIRCAIALGRKSKAEELINVEIERAEALPESSRRTRSRLLSRMYCLLGVARSDPKLLLKSWDTSGGTYAKAKRILGKYHLDRAEWKESVAHYADALRLNPVHVDAWYWQGVAAMECEDHETAQVAFSRTVGLDPENGSAWNNLAAVHLHLENYKEALGALDAAVRFKPRNWKIWENYLTTALRLRELAPACRALRQTIELRGREAVDPNIIKVLTAAIVEHTVPIIERAKEKVNKERVDAKAGTAASETGAVQLRELGLGPGSPFRLYDLALEKSVARVPHPALWGARAEIRELVSDTAAAIKFRENCCGLLETEGWAEEEATATPAVRAIARLVEAYRRAPTRENITAARFHVQGARDRIASAANIGAEHSLCEELDRMLKDLSSVDNGNPSATGSDAAPDTQDDDDDNPFADWA